MFSIARKVITQRFATRAYAARAIYVANLSPATDETKMREVFGKYGNIIGMRFGEGNNSYKYAHIYFGAGTVPESETNVFMYTRDHEATPDEILEVDTSVQKAVEENQSITVDDNLLVVRSALYRVADDKKPIRMDRAPQKAAQDVNAFNRGYFAGYRKGVEDSHKMANDPSGNASPYKQY
ncbi:hypothetical protein H4R27_003143 [Coemansia aciculifera]|uniref:RRM domain-containing protein n=1 Tax=Coemansia pectinata TaxID=1052879 RepID=A0A9W8GTA2_9FUNG|nr:hypothetical protein GGI19_003652 [Coemansia pectinata]KAJ2882893.1 hypothetical protein H4R27_003143 [Coemansia aciculifera]